MGSQVNAGPGTVAASSPLWKDAPALAFDLGETLLTYRDTPLSWSDLYGDALRAVGAKLERVIGAELIVSAEAILARHNTRLNPRTGEIGADAIFGEILASWRWPLEIRSPAIEAFFGFFQQRLVAYPETREVLLTLRKRGVRIGVLTDVPYGMPRHLVERDLAEAGLADCVDVLLTSVDVGHRKPAREGFLAMATALRVSIESLVYVGNEPKDIAGPKAAGARAVLINRTGKGIVWGQDETIRSLDQLLE
ncbi:MAG: HAD family hydrolase [Nibricoccus sp.]